MSIRSLRAWRGRRPARRCAAGLGRDEGGLAAVEFALVMPVLILILAGVMQFGSMFFVQNNMTNVARDSARRLAVGELAAADAPQYVQNTLVDWGVTYTVVVTEPDPGNPDDKDITVTISVPMAQASIVNLLDIPDTEVLRASVTARQE